MFLQRVPQRALRVQHEIDVVGGRLGTVPDKSEGVSAIPCTAHVGAKEWRRRALFLRIPWGATAGEIGGVDVLRFSLLQVFIETRPGRSDVFFRFVAVQEVE